MIISCLSAHAGWLLPSVCAGRGQTCPTAVRPCEPSSGSRRRAKQERDDHERFILFMSPSNTGPRATGDGVLRKGLCQSQRRLDVRLAKDQLPETNPKGGGQAHPSIRSPRLTWPGDEPFQRGTSDQSTRALPPGDPSGSVFSSHVQERAIPPKRYRKLCFLPNGGACRVRTDDPLLAKQVLSQLS